MSILTACGLFFTGVLTGCGAVRGENEADDGKISVVTTIFPQYDFVRQIAGDSVDLQMLLKPGEETHSYEPTPQDIIAIQNSDIFIYVGGENDAWVEDILDSMPEADMVTLKLMDCVDTLEEEHVEGMQEQPATRMRKRKMHIMRMRRRKRMPILHMRSMNMYGPLRSMHRRSWSRSRICL